MGTYGISYPGFYAASSIIGNHPALKAVSPQAPVTDWFVDDAVIHNDAFFLGNFLFFSSFGKLRSEPTTKPELRINLGTQNRYSFFLKEGAFNNLNDKYYKK